MSTHAHPIHGISSIRRSKAKHLANSTVRAENCPERPVEGTYPYAFGTGESRAMA